MTQEKNNSSKSQESPFDRRNKQIVDRERPEITLNLSALNKFLLEYQKELETSIERVIIVQLMQRISEKVLQELSDRELNIARLKQEIKNESKRRSGTDIHE